MWVKVEVGGYLRGRIFKLDEEVHVELEDNGKKIKHHRKTPEAFVPDVIPRSHEIEVSFKHSFTLAQVSSFDQRHLRTRCRSAV